MADTANPVGMPAQVGRYRVLKELGGGAMGTVYQALDPSIDRIVALKVIRSAADDEPEEREFKCSRLMKDARNAGILSHPNIVRILDLGFDDGTPYIAMEFVNGPTFKAMLAGQARPDARAAVQHARQIAGALDYAHRHGVIHRDIKPENVMIDESGVLKVTDFGISKATKSGMTEQTITESGLVLGTPHYMSPEQIQCLKLDGRSDQFSLGVLVYEMLTGSKPFEAGDIPAILFKIVYEEPRSPSDVDPDVGAAVSGAVLKALSKSPEQRYESCLEFVTNLDAAIQADETGAPFEPTEGELRTASLGAASRFVSRTVTSHALVAYTRLRGMLWSMSDRFAWARQIRSMDRGSLLALAASVAVGIAGILMLLFWPSPRRPERRPAEAQAAPVRIEQPAPAAPQVTPPPETPPPPKQPIQKKKSAPPRRARPARPAPAVPEPKPPEEVKPTMAKPARIRQ